MLSQIRRLEIKQIRAGSILKGINMAMYFVSAKCLLFISCILYTTVAGGTLNPEKVFVTMALLGSVRTLFFHLFNHYL